LTWARAKKTDVRTVTKVNIEIENMASLEKRLKMNNISRNAMADGVNGYSK